MRHDESDWDIPELNNWAENNPDDLLTQMKKFWNNITPEPYYKLVDKKVVRCTREEADWGDSRRVQCHQVGHFRISTVFLPIDHSFTYEGPPVVFETMVFDESFEGTTTYVNKDGSMWDAHRDTEMWRCCTWDEAVNQHWEAVYQYEQLTRTMAVEIEVPDSSRTPRKSPVKDRETKPGPPPCSSEDGSPSRTTAMRRLWGWARATLRSWFTRG